MMNDAARANLPECAKRTPDGQLQAIMEEQRAVICDLKQAQSGSEMIYLRLYQKYMDLRRQNEALSRQMDALLHSRSFRVTAPLRSMKQRVKRWIGR